MPRAWDQSQTSFGAGVLSPATQDQVQSEVYAQGARSLVNVLPLRHGGVKTRSGLIPVERSLDIPAARQATDPLYPLAGATINITREVGVVTIANDRDRPESQTSLLRFTGESDLITAYPSTPPETLYPRHQDDSVPVSTLKIMEIVFPDPAIPLLSLDFSILYETITDANIRRVEGGKTYTYFRYVLAATIPGIPMKKFMLTEWRVEDGDGDSRRYALQVGSSLTYDPRRTVLDPRLPNTDTPAVWLPAPGTSNTAKRALDRGKKIAYDKIELLLVSPPSAPSTLSNGRLYFGNISAAEQGSDYTSNLWEGTGKSALDRYISEQFQKTDNIPSQDFIRIIPWVSRESRSWIIALYGTGISAYSVPFSVEGDGTLQSISLGGPFSSVYPGRRTFSASALREITFSVYGNSIYLFHQSLVKPLKINISDVESGASAITITEHEWSTTKTPMESDAALWGTETAGGVSAGLFYQGRLIVCGTRRYPSLVAVSKIGDFTDFIPTESNPTDADGFHFIQASPSGNSLHAIHEGQRIFFFGAQGESYLAEEVLSGNTFRIIEASHIGTDPGVVPVQVDSSTMFIAAGGRDVRRLVFSEEEGTFKTLSLFTRAAHLLNRPIVSLATLPASAQRPETLLAAREDEVILRWTTDRISGMAAWSTIDLGAAPATRLGFYRNGEPRELKTDDTDPDMIQSTLDKDASPSALARSGFRAMRMAHTLNRAFVLIREVDPSAPDTTRQQVICEIGNESSPSIDFVEEYHATRSNGIYTLHPVLHNITIHDVDVKDMSGGRVSLTIRNVLLEIIGRPTRSKRMTDPNDAPSTIIGDMHRVRLYYETLTGHNNTDIPFVSLDVEEIARLLGSNMKGGDGGELWDGVDPEGFILRVGLPVWWHVETLPFVSRVQGEGIVATRPANIRDIILDFTPDNAPLLDLDVQSDIFHTDTWSYFDDVSGRFVVRKVREERRRRDHALRNNNLALRTRALPGWDKRQIISIHGQDSATLAGIFYRVIA